MSDSNVPTEVKIAGYLKVSKIIVWLMYIWVMIGVIALALRVFLLAASANAGSGFTNFIYKLSNDYLEPFRGIFTPKDVGETGYLDVAAMFAIIIYLLIAWGFKTLIHYIEHKTEISEMEQRDAIAKAERKRNLDQMNSQKATKKTA